MMSWAVPLTGSKGEVILGGYDSWAIEVSPDDQFMATISYGSGIHIWDIHTGELVSNLYSPAFTDSSLTYYNWASFSNDGSQIAVAGYPPSVWDVKKGVKIRDLATPIDVVIGKVGYHPQRDILVGSDSVRLYTWNAITGELLNVLSPQEREFSLPQSIRSIFRFKRLTIPPTLAVLEVIMPTDEEGLIIDQESFFVLWDSMTQSVIQKRKRDKGFEGADFSSDTRTLLVSLWDRVLIFDTVSGQQIDEIPTLKFDTREGSNSIVQMGFSFDDSVIGIRNVWSAQFFNRANSAEIKRLISENNNTSGWDALAFQFLHRSSHVLLGATDHVYLCDYGLDKEGRVRSYHNGLHTDRVREVDYSPDGTTLLTTDSHAVYFWDLVSGTQISQIPNINQAQFLSNQEIIGIDNQNRIVQYQVNGQLIRETAPFDSTLTQFHPSNSPLLALQEWNAPNINFLDITSNQIVHTLVPPAAKYFRSMALSPTGKYFLVSLFNSSYNDFSCTLYETENFNPLYTFTVPTWPEQMVISKDEEVFALLLVGDFLTGDTYQTVEIRDLRTGEVATRIINILSDLGNDGVFDIDFSPNNRWVAVNTRRNIGKVYDRSTGKELLRLKTRLMETDDASYYNYSPLRFSPNNQALIIGYSDGTARIWDLSPLYQGLSDVGYFEQYQ